MLTKRGRPNSQANKQASSQATSQINFTGSATPAHSVGKSTGKWWIACASAAIAAGVLLPMSPSPFCNEARAQTATSQKAEAVQPVQPVKPAQPANSTAATENLLAADAAILKKLNDPSYMVRDLAMTTLLGNDQLTDAAIDKLYAATTTAEQRVRLRQVAVHHTARRLSLKSAKPTDAAVLGMSPSPQNNLPNKTNGLTGTYEAAVVVRWTFPGSVAFAHLRQGDVITQVNNKPIPAAGNAGQITSAFIQIIASRRAGDDISFHVLRDGHPLDVKLKLGSGNALQSIYQSARTSQSRQFNTACAKEVSERLEALEKLSPAPKPLTLTLPTPAAEPAADAVTDEAAAAKPADAKRIVPHAQSFDEIWGDVEN